MARSRSLLALLGAALVFTTAGAPGADKPKAPAATPAPASPEAKLIEGFSWREIGPFRGGRVTAVAGVPGQPLVYYMGATGGGVWKTTNAGASWSPLTDGQVKTGSVGAVAVAPSDPNVVYAGMGESCIRGNVSHGDGVYRTTDAGKTWSHVGLRETMQIGRIQVHPKRPRPRVRRRARAHLGAERRARRLPLEGRRQDAGRRCSSSTTRRAPSTSRWTPPIRACCMPATWQVQRTPWSLESGGPGSAPPQDGGRRRHLEEARREGPAEGPLGTHRRDGLPRPAGARLRRDRGRGGRRLPLRRRGRDLAAHQRRPAACASVPGTTRTSTPTRRTPTRSTCSTSGSSARKTAARRSSRSARRTATTTTCGSHPRIRGGWSRATTAAPTSASTAARAGRRSTTSRRRSSTT